jgi:hypothetical protein
LLQALQARSGSVANRYRQARSAPLRESISQSASPETFAVEVAHGVVGVNAVGASARHATPGFTMATYQHVLPGMQADAARVFAGLIASTGFNPVERSVEGLTDAENSKPETSSDQDFLVAGGGFEPPTFGL